MALVDSLLTAIIRADGDALVMHVGEKPYVVASAAPIELSTQGLNLEAMVGMLTQLLPAELQRALAEFGAVEHELPSTAATDGDRFTVVAARGGDDVWIEIRRHRRPRASTVSSGTTEAMVDTSIVASGTTETMVDPSTVASVTTVSTVASGAAEPMVDQSALGCATGEMAGAEAKVVSGPEEAVADRA